MGMWRSGLARAGPGRGGAKGKDREGAGARGGGEGGIWGGGLGVRVQVRPRREGWRAAARSAALAEA